MGDLRYLWFVLNEQILFGHIWLTRGKFEPDYIISLLQESVPDAGGRFAVDGLSPGFWLCVQITCFHIHPISLSLACFNLHAVAKTN